MMPSEAMDFVVVMDLDDTLYKEADYNASGLKKVCCWVEYFYGVPVTKKLDELRKSEKSDLLADLCRLANIPLPTKESLLWIYRLHQPEINLTPKVTSLIKHLEANYKIAILTDGRSITQRLKLKSLGLSHLPVYISEEHGTEKPSPARFELIMREIPASHYFYIGDNPKKDFLAPNSLGWTTIGLRDDGRNIHKQILTGLEPDYLPKHWIVSLDELLKYLC